MKHEKIKAGIIGAAGYTGHELIKLLSKRSDVELIVLNSETSAGKKVSELYPDFKGNNVYTNFSMAEINALGLDVIFLATPNGAAMNLVPQLNCKVIDLSADYRFSNTKTYEKTYQTKHTHPVKAVYGLPELFAQKISKASLVANPGCYATASILAAYPIQKYAKYIVLDCKSGYSGAGKKPSFVSDPENYTDNIIPYNIVSHRHKPEIEQFIKTKLSFTPHALPTFRGLMCTAHILLKKKISAEKAAEIYAKFYAGKPFVKIMRDRIPNLHDAQNTNYCVLGGFEIDDNNQLVVVSVIDNLLKGASGQAVQNMNLMFGRDQKTGLVRL